MKKDNILGVVVMACGLLLVLCVFLPYISYFSTSMSLWKAEDSSRFMYILLGLFVIFLYLVNKKTEMAYLAAGYGIFTSVAQIISLGGFEGLSIAFYLILISSILIGVITFLYNEEEADSLVNVNNSNIVSQDTQSIGADQVQQPNPLKFDPMTGQPIYSNPNNN